MSLMMFDRPVFVKDGSHIIQEVACLEDALEYLYDWPKKRRGETYETALGACKRAFEANYPRSAARDAFADFANSEGILEEVSEPLPWMTVSGAERGGVAS